MVNLQTLYDHRVFQYRNLLKAHDRIVVNDNSSGVATEILRRRIRSIGDRIIYIGKALGLEGAFVPAELTESAARKRERETSATVDRVKDKLPPSLQQ